MKIRFHPVIAIILFCIPLLSMAQQSATQAHIELSEQFPNPHSPVQATITNHEGGSALGDLYWQIDNQSQPEFTNQRTIEFTARGPGQASTIKTFRGNTLIGETSITPIYIDIHVDADTTVPNFYQGRPLPTAGSDVLLTAIVEDTVPQAAGQYTYTWRINNSSVGGGAQRGRDQISVTVPNRREMNVSVAISHPDRGVVGQRNVSIPVAQSELHFYEVNSLYGVKHKSLQSSVSMLGSNLTLQAEPYYVPTNTLTNDARTTWRVNGRSVSSDERNPFRITLQRSYGQGASGVEFIFQNVTNMVHSASGKLRINY